MMTTSTKTKTIKLVAAVTAVAAFLGVCYWHGQAEEARMDQYASENNCTWHYDYYINKPPICK